MVSTEVANFTPYIINTTIAFSTGASIFRATTNSGSTIGITSHSTAGRDRLYAPNSYVSNTPITASSTWSGTTIAGLGLIPGTYVVTWGSGETADSLTINIDESEPASTYTVGGTVSGLTGAGLELQNNGGDTLAVAAAATAFTFATELEVGFSYVVTVSTEPTGQTCTVSNGSGTISDADVTDVAVTCTDNPEPLYTINGSASGLGPNSVTLQNNLTDDLVVSANGVFVFATALPDGSTYDVTVLTQPTGQTCVVTNGFGTINGSDVLGVTVTCTDSVYTVGGIVTGLTGTGLALQNNGSDTLAIAASGDFIFATGMLSGEDYLVTVSAQPVGQNCVVSFGGGTIATADVTDVAVDCADVVVPPPTPSEPIPSLSEWALILLTMFIGLMVFANRRRLF